MFSGGTASVTTVSGGYEYVYSGGRAVSTTVSSGGTLVVSSGGSISTTSMTSGGAIQLDLVAYAAGATISVNSATDVLTISAGGNTYTEQLVGDYTGATFAVTAAGDGSLLVTDTTTPCFCRGTFILTARGEVAVENLAVGDLVVTATGATAPITWIGFGRTLVTPAHRGSATPILVARNALADNVPCRDLRITKGHSLFPRRRADSGGIPGQPSLHPAGTTTRRWSSSTISNCRRHDVLLANGALAESYRDDGNR